MNLVATIEKVRPNQSLTSRGHVRAPWLFEGHRRCETHAVGERRVRVTHVEDIHGLLAPLFAVFMGNPVEQSHRALNDALRRRAESVRSS